MNKLELLPVIIDRPGNYLRRDNKIVRIRDVDESVKGFSCRGATVRMVNGTPAISGYSNWHKSGRHNHLKMTDKDIVKRL